MTTDIARPAGALSPRGRDKHRLVIPSLCGAILVAGLVTMATGTLLAPQNPFTQDPLLSVTLPGHAHLLGTDQLGRDVLSQLIAGTRPALLGPLAVAVGCVLIGCGAGMVAAYRGGVIDAVVTRCADLILALPALLIAVVVVGVVGGGYWFTVGVLLVLSLPYEIRLTRSAALVVVRMPYIEAARTLGHGSTRILIRHVLPNIMPTVVATFLLDFVIALIGFVSLSFLHLGVPPNQPSWGGMLADGQQLIGQNPWLSIAPAVLLILTAASATLLGDAVYERISRRGTQQ
ncbi:ABC transporter permease [Amycolatopsis pithecellobii]|uniref:ABC transporter permease subunit n=1 Tax=Amycolatopsis pithecellobii TaxID=664692 RepID=A0A6N7YRQ6_9PSEU|nr:ABC transporter permease [Amycolatopsis pithecellobii]MTD54642.1 ABC transporter permease subunit [Amycolatopsis pithecellobii]